MRLEKNIYHNTFRKLETQHNARYEGCFITNSYKGYCINDIDIGYTTYRNYIKFYI